jgi:hypothetical protein
MSKGISRESVEKTERRPSGALTANSFAPSGVNSMGWQWRASKCMKFSAARAINAPPDDMMIKMEQNADTDLRRDEVSR